MTTQQTRGIYLISVVAETLDMHPQTLRKYERAGFVVPLRMGALRTYSDEDVARLRLVKHFVDDMGLNLAGVQLAPQDDLRAAGPAPRNGGGQRPGGAHRRHACNARRARGAARPARTGQGGTRRGMVPGQRGRGSGVRYRTGLRLTAGYACHKFLSHLETVVGFLP